MKFKLLTKSIFTFMLITIILNSSLNTVHGSQNNPTKNIPKQVVTPKSDRCFFNSKLLTKYENKDLQLLDKKYYLNLYSNSNLQPYAIIYKVKYDKTFIFKRGVDYSNYIAVDWIAHKSARGTFLPAVQAIQHLEFKEDIRSTGLSVMNFAVEAIIAISYFVSAPIIDNLDISIAWAVTLFAFIVSVALTSNRLKKSLSNQRLSKFGY